MCSGIVGLGWVMGQVVERGLDFRICDMIKGKVEQHLYIVDVISRFLERIRHRPICDANVAPNNSMRH